MKKIILLSALLTACAGVPNYKNAIIGSKTVIQKNDAAVDSLNTQLSTLKTQKEYPLIVATVSNMNQLNQTSTFGRLVSEQVAARFTQLSYVIIEPKMRSDLLIKEDGEFLITRELKDLAKSASAQAVVVGTYVENDQDVYVNLKVVQPFTNHVLAATSYAIPKAKDIRGLLAN